MLNLRFRKLYNVCSISIIYLSISRQALMTATPTDIQDIADILGVTFQEHCMATPLKVAHDCKEKTYI